MRGLRSGLRGEVSREVGERRQSEHDMRAQILDYMRAHPVSWRAPSLARKLKAPTGSLREALSQLRKDGLLVSCTVMRAKRPPEEQYRIAAHSASANLHKFVIGKNSITGRPVAR